MSENVTGKSVYLVKAETGEFVRLVVGEENAEGFVLVRTADEVVKSFTDAVLDDNGYADADEFLRNLAANKISKQFRSKVRNATHGVTTKLALELPKTAQPKPRGFPRKKSNGEDSVSLETDQPQTF